MQFGQAVWPAKEKGVGLGDVRGRAAVQFFVRGNCTMIAAPIQCDVDGIPKGPHDATLSPMGSTRVSNGSHVSAETSDPIADVECTTGGGEPPLIARNGTSQSGHSSLTVIYPDWGGASYSNGFLWWEPA